MISEAFELQNLLQERWATLQISFLLAIPVLLLSISKGFFVPLTPFEEGSALARIRGIDVLKGFGAFILAQIFAAPLIASMAFFLQDRAVLGSLESFHATSLGGWINFALIAISFVCLLGVYRSLNAFQKEAIWRRKAASPPVNFLLGILSLFICYPLVLFLNQALALALWYVAGQPFIEQTVVQHVRSLVNNTPLFLLTGISMVILVPWSEEFLFRALLQSWLKSLFRHSWVAIVLSSAIFSLFHFSLAQGLNNIDLLFSLFLLSCMLGYLFERQGSLWAPMGLHSFFNATNLLMLYIKT